MSVLKALRVIKTVAAPSASTPTSDGAPAAPVNVEMSPMNDKTTMQTLMIFNPMEVLIPHAHSGSGEDMFQLGSVQGIYIRETWMWH